MLNINAKTNEIIDSDSLDGWDYVKSEMANIVYTYHVDEKAETEHELVAEYPNGGREYREVIVKPERGHFTVTNDDGSNFPYPVEVPDGISKDYPVPDIIELAYWDR